MGETVTLLETRVHRAIERLRAWGTERGELQRAMTEAAETLEALGRDLESGGEDA
jgi:hypothetical protein